MKPIPLTETQMAELFRLRDENAALKAELEGEKQRDELLAALSFYLTSWDGCSRCGSRLTPF